MFYIIDLNSRMFVRKYPDQKDTETQKKRTEALLLELYKEMPDKVLSVGQADDQGNTIWKSTVIIGPKGREANIILPEKINAKQLTRSHRKSRGDARRKFDSDMKSLLRRFSTTTYKLDQDHQKLRKELMKNLYTLDQEYYSQRKFAIEEFNKQADELRDELFKGMDAALDGLETGIKRKKIQVLTSGYRPDGSWADSTADKPQT